MPNNYVNCNILIIHVQVFTAGLELVLKVSESHIKRIFEIIVGCYNVTVQARFIVTLLAMAKVC